MLVPKVHSILGCEFDRPVYRDRRGRRRSFRTLLRDGTWSIVGGVEVQLGLVLHRSLGKPGPMTGHLAWTVSDPVSGRSVVKGNTRQGALDELANMVGYCGGEKGFVQRLAAARASIQVG